MSLAHRLLVWLLLLGVVLHAPLPMQSHGYRAGQVELLGFCGSASSIAALQERTPLPLDDGGSSAPTDDHSCCLLCEHPDSNGVLAGERTLSPPRLLLLSLIRLPLSPPLHWLQPIYAGMARAPPQV